MNRSGTKSLFGTAKALAGQQEIGILRNIAVYLSVPRRLVSLKVHPEHVSNLVGQNIRITFGAEEQSDNTASAEISFTPG